MEIVTGNLQPSEVSLTASRMRSAIILAPSVVVSGRIRVDTSSDLRVLSLRRLQPAGRECLTVDLYEVDQTDTPDLQCGGSQVPEVKKSARANKGGLPKLLAYEGR